MNREILFRGKSADNGDWAYGYLYITCTGEYQIRRYNKWTAIVDPDTVGQYTGLTDKCGKKIFEGDIVRLVHDWHDGTNEPWVAVVEFGNPNGTYSWGWQLKYVRGEVNYNRDILLWVDMEATSAFCEVIGNVWDDPELVEQGEAKA